ncbi:hypothetical protein Barb6XT_00795 [Bacteroidales bacterium Barb6XT]|nr:hypothetical protein Barb6XT_00795 [Bacteroidales bacterium Barb6XT]
MSAIKKYNLIKRLQSTINLTLDEESRLKIACIAADPKGKGLQHWFRQMDDYLKRSHIGILHEYTKLVVESKDKDTLRSETDIAIVKDVVLKVAKQIGIVDKPLSNSLDQIKMQMNDMDNDCTILKRELNQSKSLMTEALKELKKSIFSDVNNATSQTIANVIADKLGIENNKVTCYVLNRSVNQILSECSETNNATLNSKMIDFEQNFNMQDAMIKDCLKVGSQYLKTVTINANMIKTGRDIFAKGYKFKPWEAVKMGEKFTKVMGRIGMFLAFAMEAWNWYRSYSDQKELTKLKEDLKSSVNDIFASIFADFDKDEDYYNNFAPSYLEMCKRIAERKKEIYELEKQVFSLRNYKDRIKTWFGNDIEDATFEEL